MHHLANVYDFCSLIFATISTFCRVHRCVTYSIGSVQIHDNNKLCTSRVYFKRTRAKQESRYTCYTYIICAVCIFFGTLVAYTILLLYIFGEFFFSVHYCTFFRERLARGSRLQGHDLGVRQARGLCIGELI